MLDSIIKRAESLGNQIAGGKQNEEKSTSMVHVPDQPLALYKPAKIAGITFFKLKPFRDNELGVSNWENLLRNLSSIPGELTFVISGNNRNIELYVGIPDAYATHFENMFYASFKTSELVPTSEVPLPKDNYYFQFKDKTEFASIATFKKDGSYNDPFKDVLSVYNSVDKTSRLTITFKFAYKVKKTMLSKLLDSLGNAIKNAVFKKKEEKKKDEKKEEVKDVTDVHMKMGYHIATANPALKDAVSKTLKSIMNIFVIKGGISVKYNAPKTHKMDRSQFANFFHLPTKVNYTQQLDYAVYRRLPAPITIGTLQNTPSDELTIVGKTDYRGEPVEFGIMEEDKFRHMYIIGKTGTGKSTFLSNLIKSDIVRGKGVGLLDPHGELVDTIMEHIPSHRINDVILFDVSDDEYPVGFNLLQYRNQDEKLRVASGVVTTFKKLFGHSWGPRLEYILRNIMLTLVDYPNATLMHILRMLTDKNFREEVLSFCKDSLILKFWREEFDRWNDKQIQDAIGPITNKVGQFLSSSVVRNIFGQPRAKLSIREAMDQGKILLVNLSKGKIGDDNAAMIGSLLVTKFQIEAMARADMAKELRRPFYMYIDEFQNFATDSFATILSEARKYKLSLIVANQYTSQLDDAIRDAIFGNIGTIISFTLGYDDAKVISNQFKELVSTNDLISLPRFTAYTRMMVDGITSDPFSMKTLPLSTPEGSQELIKKVIDQTRQRYATHKPVLESLMKAWADRSFSPQEKVAERAKLEGLGFLASEIEDLEDPQVRAKLGLFSEYRIGRNEPDAMLIDLTEGDHKAVWYEKPDGIQDETKPHPQLVHGGTMQFFLHDRMENEATEPKPLEIWTGPQEAAQQRAKSDYADTKRRKFVRNVQKLESKIPVKVTMPGTRVGNVAAQPNLAQKPVARSAATPVAPMVGGFTIDDIEEGKEYEGYVKLTYNYGIFITVKGVEGLLHKNYIKDPAPGVTWKKFYNIGDKIKAYAIGFKEVNGEKKVVWSQYPKPKQPSIIPKTTTKPAAKPIAKPAARPTVKPASRPAAKPATTAPKPKVAPKAPTKPSAPVSKPVAPATRPVGSVPRPVTPAQKPVVTHPPKPQQPAVAKAPGPAAVNPHQKHNPTQHSQH